DLSAARHAQEMPEHLQATHAHEDHDVEQAVGGVCLRCQREAESMEWTVADGDRWRGGAISLAVDHQPERRLPAPYRAPRGPGSGQPAKAVANLGDTETSRVQPDAGRFEEGRSFRRWIDGCGLPCRVARGNVPGRAGVDGRRSPTNDGAQRLLTIGRDAGPTGDVVEGSERNDAQRRRRAQQNGGRRADRSVAAGDHDVTTLFRRPRGQLPRVVVLHELAQLDLETILHEGLEQLCWALRLLGTGPAGPSSSRWIDEQQDRAASLVTHAGREASPLATGSALAPGRPFDTSGSA